MEHGRQRKIAEQIGISPAYLNDILRRRRSCSVKMAAALESATGIERRAWLYPDEFPNPFIQGDRKAAIDD